MSEPISKEQKISVKLKVEVYGPDGKLKASTEKENDLFLNQFGLFLRGMLRSGGTAGNLGVIATSSTTEMLDITGQTISASPASLQLNSYNGEYSIAGPSFYLGCYNGAHVSFPSTNVVRGYIGTGVTAPARSNFNLVTVFGSGVQPNADAVYSNGTITFSFSFPISSSATITEAGVTKKMLITNSTGGNAQNREYMLMRDIFTALSVIAGDTVITTYTILF